MEKQIFEYIESRGELLEGDIHIIDTSDEFPCHDKDRCYRVYHSNGYCFDIKREYVCDPSEIGQFDDVHSDGFHYEFFTEWGGFENLSCNHKSFNIIKSWFK